MVGASYRERGEAPWRSTTPATRYHDDSDWPHLELGPSDDRRYVEQLFKAIFQAGLSWPVVESHWPAFSEVFHGFDPVQVAAMTEEEIDRAEHDPPDHP